MLTVSLIDENDLGKVTATREVPNLSFLRTTCVKSNWAPARFSGRRTIKEAIQTDIIVLDVDSGCTLDQFNKDVAAHGYEFALMTSKSHTYEANRFRFILLLDESIKNDNDFKATFQAVQAQFPYVDKACKDISRFFYPAKEWLCHMKGKPFKTVRASASPAKTPANTHKTEKGDLWKSTLKFLLEGAPQGEWHFEMHKALRNMKEQGYSQDEAQERLASMCAVSEYSTGDLDYKDLALIRDVYLNRETKYEFKTQEDDLDTVLQNSTPILSTSKTVGELLDESFVYLADKDLVKGEPSGLEGLDRMLGGGFREGELTVLMAEAKTGKNALYHFLMHKQLCRGIAMGYASRELDPAREVIPNLLSIEFEKNLWSTDITPEVRTLAREATSKWQLHFAEGYGYFPLASLQDWFINLVKVGVKHFWLDHLHYMLEEPEEHKHASKLIKELKTLAKQLGIHINLIVQPNKIGEYNGIRQKMGLNTIKGGSAIGQALDNLLILERVQGEKNVSRLRLDAARHRLCKPGEILLEYNPETTRFGEVERVVQPAQNPFQPHGMSGQHRRGLAPPTERPPRKWNQIDS
jgi:hypothetical protein